jgi:four helix bundle protein
MIGEKRTAIETFEDLDVWKFCVEIRKDISDLVKAFPKEERFRLADQMIRASRSVTANIAEGFGRFHYQESIQFCRQARGSLYELIDHLHVATEENWLPREVMTQQRAKILREITILNGFIRYLSKNKRKLVDE